MNERRKKLIWPWITVALLFMFVVYPLSSGPVLWLRLKLDDPRRHNRWVDTAHDCLNVAEEFIYAPLFFAVDRGPDWLYHLYGEYTNYWSMLAD